MDLMCVHVYTYIYTSDIRLNVKQNVANTYIEKGSPICSDRRLSKKQEREVECKLREITFILQGDLMVSLQFYMTLSTKID